MRILQRVGIFLTPAFVFFCGCGGIGVTAPTVMAPPPSQAIPNLGQMITPMAPYNSTFQSLVPGVDVLPNAAEI